MVGTRSTRSKGKEPIREPLRERSLSYDDPNALGEAGENQAARLQDRIQHPPEETGKLSIGAKDIARYLEINRSIDWNENTGPQSAGAGKQRTASVLQRRGDVSQPACSRCEQGNRVFGSCVAAPAISGYAFQRGACANCIWDGKERSCSLKGENMPLDSTSILQFTGEGFNLRQAILEEAWIDGDGSQLEPPAPMEMEMEVYVDPENEVDAPEVSSGKDDKVSSDKNDDKASSDKENVDVATFLAEIKPDSSFARIGISQHGPRCRFDGVELKFPISREIWESERRLLKARSDLAHFVAIIDARLFDMGHGRSDAVFWEREARRLTRLFATGIRRKRGRSSRRPSLTPPPRIVVSEAITPSSQLMPDPTPQTEPQSTGETIQALTEPPQSLLPSTNTEATRTEAKQHTPPTIATSSRDQRVWDRPQTPESKHNDKERPEFGPVHVQEDFENLHDAIEQFTAVMGGPPKAPAEEPAPTCVDPDEEERESCKQSADPAPAPAPTEPVRAKFTDHEERAATEPRRSFWTLRRPRPKDLDEGSPPIVSKRFRSERHGDRASE